MVRILCLHGYGQSGLTLQTWCSGLISEIDNLIPNTSFLFPTAHITVSMENSKDLATIPSKLRQGTHAWNHGYLDWKRQFAGLPEAIAYLKIILEADWPFDGIVGFSQGAAYGVALAALVETPSLAAECNLPVIKHPPFKFAVLYSGCKVSTFRFAPLYRDIRTPMLIYYCIGDKIIPNRWSLALAANCTNAVVLSHTEGHRIPLDPDAAKIAAGFIAGAMAGLDEISPDAEPRQSPPRCASDWMSLIEETPFALPRL